MTTSVLQSLKVQALLLRAAKPKDKKPTKRDKLILYPRV